MSEKILLNTSADLTWVSQVDYLNHYSVRIDLNEVCYKGKKIKGGILRLSLISEFNGKLCSKCGFPCRQNCNLISFK